MEERRRRYGAAHSAHDARQPLVPFAPLDSSAANRGSGVASRRFTARHAQLLADLLLRDSDVWSATALWACLEHLRVSTVTEASRVAVIDAWTDGPDAFCIVYHPPFDDTRVVGLRRASHAADVDSHVGRVPTRNDTTNDVTADSINWGYDLGTVGAAGSVDPVAFGWNVADFDVGEPLGFVATILRPDAGGVGWWGNLDTALPRPPDGRLGDTR